MGPDLRVQAERGVQREPASCSGTRGLRPSGSGIPAQLPMGSNHPRDSHTSIRSLPPLTEGRSEDPRTGHHSLCALKGSGGDSSWVRGHCV